MKAKVPNQVKASTKVKNKVQMIEGLPKIVEGKGNNQKVFHFIEGKDYRFQRAKKLTKKEPFTDSIVVANDPDTNELSFKVYWSNPSVEVGFLGKKVKHNVGVSYFSIEKLGIMQAQARASAYFDTKMFLAFKAGDKKAFIPDSCLFKDYNKFINYFQEKDAANKVLRLNKKTQVFVESFKKQEYPADASYIEGHYFVDAPEFKGFKILHKETGKVGQFPLSFGLMPAFSASIRWLEKQNKVKK